MNTLRTLKSDRVRYATAADFMEIFTSEMHSLFILSLLLTGDMKKAEQCFVSALEECMDGMDSFLEWARLWARRSIIKHAIALIMPTRNFVDRLPSSCLKWPVAREPRNTLQALLELSALDRFAFVMSLIERQSDQDCALLLGCRRRDFEEARARAISTLSRSGYGRNPDEEAKIAWQAICLRQKTGTNAGLVA
jgi:hypothetical protein